MSPRRTRILITGVFYAVVLTLVGATSGASVLRPSPARLDALERDARAAFSSHDSAHFERFYQIYAELCAVYSAAGRWQELAWTHFEFGYDAEGEKLEREILLKLAADAPAGPSVRLNEHSGRILLETYADGFRADRVTRDFFKDDEATAALFDQRRFAVSVYQVSRALGWNLVPATTFTVRNGHQYLIRSHIDDLTEYPLNHRIVPYVDERLHVLDYLTGQMDRNRGGLGFRPGGDLVAFDNKHALGFKDFALAPKDWVVPAQRPPLQLSEETRAAILKLKKKLAEPHTKRFALLSIAERTSLSLRIETLLALPLIKPVPAPALPTPVKALPAAPRIEPAVEDEPITGFCEWMILA